MIELIVPLLILAISLIILALASHFTIKSIEKLIKLTGLSETSAGIVILAVMTSTPKIIVALFSVLQGEPVISIGDILGSNVFNLGAVLGIARASTKFIAEPVPISIKLYSFISNTSGLPL